MELRSNKLMRDDGKNVTLIDELNDGRPVVLNFIYTTCTGICPLASHIFSQLQQLEALRMCLQWNLSEFCAGCRIDHSEGAAAVSDDDLMSGAVDSHIVDIRPKVDCSGGRKVRTVQDSDRAIAAVGDMDSVRSCLVANPLRFMKPRERPNHRTVLEIHDSDAAIA